MIKRGTAIFLLIMPFVSAQEVTIGGKSYSLLFISPLVIIALVILFLLFSFIVKKMGKFKLPKFNLKKKEKEVKVKSEGPEIKFEVDKELDEFKKRVNKLEVKEGLNQFIGLFRDYFAIKFGISKQFTFEELEIILQKKAKRYVNISNEIAHLKYSGKTLDRENLNKLIGSFSRLVSSEKTEKPKEEVVKKISLFNKIDIKDFGFKNLKISMKNLFKRTKEKERPVVLGFKIKGVDIQVTRKHSKFNPVSWYYSIKDYIEVRKNKDNKNIVERLIRKGRRIARKDWKEATRDYNKALSVYYKLPVNDEEKVASSLIDLYGDIERSKLDEESRHMAEVSEKIQNILKDQGIVEKEPEREIVKHSRDSLKHIRETVLGWKSNVNERVENIKGHLNNKFKDVETDVKEDVHTLFIKPKLRNESLSIHKLRGLKSVRVRLPKRHREKLFDFNIPNNEVKEVSNKLVQQKINSLKGDSIRLPILEAENPVLAKLKDLAYHVKAVEAEGLMELKLREREIAKHLRGLLHFHKKRHERYEKPVEYMLNKDLQRVYDDVPDLSVDRKKVDALLMQKQKLINKYKRAQIDAKKDYIQHLLQRIDDYEKRRLDIIRTEIKKPMVRIRAKNVDELKKQEQDIVNRLSNFEKGKLEEIKENIRESIDDFEEEEHNIGKRAWEADAEKIRLRNPRNVNVLSKQEKELFNKLTDLKKEVNLKDPDWVEKVDKLKEKSSKEVAKLSKEQVKLFKKLNKI
ncbi:MAG: hypothetical protein PHG05_00780 [Candidatus Nanoarchaeia archaeon]|nr:hypothetical protein [Candidatus Nanoarchaeia archaeon]